MTLIEQLRTWDEIPDVAAQLERADWEPEEALRFYADGKHFDIVDGRTRILDTGGIASNALKSASLEYLERKGDAELFELRATIERQAAQIEMMRDGLKRADDLLRTSYDHVSPLIREALSTTPDQALEQFAAKVREQAIKEISHERTPRQIASAIRALKELPQ